MYLALGAIVLRLTNPETGADDFVGRIKNVTPNLTTVNTSSQCWITGRHNIRSLDTIQQTGFLVRHGVGKALTFATLIGPKHTRQPALLKGW